MATERECISSTWQVHFKQHRSFQLSSYFPVIFFTFKLRWLWSIKKKINKQLLSTLNTALSYELSAHNYEELE